MSYNAFRINAELFGEPWQDGSIGLMEAKEDGSFLATVNDYSSEVSAVFHCSNQATLQWFAFRFSRSLDSWHDCFAVGPIAKFQLKHRPAGGDGDIVQQLTSDIELSFVGWEYDGTIYPNLDDAIEAVNRPVAR